MGHGKAEAEKRQFRQSGRSNKAPWQGLLNPQFLPAFKGDIIGDCSMSASHLDHVLKGLSAWLTC